MKITFTANKSFTQFLQGLNSEISFTEDAYLLALFASKGHEVTYVHPSEIISHNNEVYFSSEWKLSGASPLYSRDVSGVQPVQVGKNVSPSADVVFVRGLGEDEDASFQKKRTFFKSLFSLENQVNLMLNSARTTHFEIKEEQKKLDLPFIPYWRVNSKADVKDLLDYEKDLIFKPDIGFMGRGVQYISSGNSLDFLTDEMLKYASFEKVIPEQKEIRYIVMDGDILLVREAKRTGDLGAEQNSSISLIPNNDVKREEIVKSAIQKTGLFYGSVDFRGDNHLLEINGSGTSIGVSYGLYNLGPTLVTAVEKKFNQ